MSKKVMAVVLAVLLAMSIAACSKKPQEAAAPAGGAPQGGQLPSGHPPTGGQPGGPVVVPPQQMQVIIPDNVKGKWSSVKLAIEDKAAKSVKEVTVKIGSDYKIPNSNLSVKVSAFLPDFKMEGAIITSATDQPQNPAVRVVISEGGKEIFTNWLYAKFPAIHPFQHDKFGVILKEGAK